MSRRTLVARALLLAGTVGALALLALPANAQQPPAEHATGRSGTGREAAAAAWSSVDRTARYAGRTEARAGCSAADRHGGRQIAAQPTDAAEGVQDRGLCKWPRQCAHDAAGRQGHRVRLHAHARQGLCHRRQERKARGEGDRLRPLSAERARVSQRHALHRRAVSNLQDREHRGQSRQPAETDRDLQRPAQGRGARMEVPRVRA